MKHKDIMIIEPADKDVAGRQRDEFVEDPITDLTRLEKLKWSWKSATYNQTKRITMIDALIIMLMFVSFVLLVVVIPSLAVSQARRRDSRQGDEPEEEDLINKYG